VVEVGELEGITKEEYGRVVPHQIPVSLLGIEFHGEAPDVPLGVGGASLTGDGGETQETVGLLAHRGENLGLGVLGDVVGNGERALGAGALGVHAPLRDHLPVKVASFSRNQTSCSRAGPRGPAAMVFWLSTTGAPFLVVHFLDSFSINLLSYLQV